MVSRQTQQQRRRRRAGERARRQTAMGPPLPLTDAALTAAAAVTPEDQASAEALVKATAGQRGLNMLQAEPDRSV